MFGPKTLSALIALLALSAAPEASAQEWNFSIGKRSKHGQVSLDFGTRPRITYQHNRKYDRHHDRRYDARQNRRYSSRDRRAQIGHRHHHVHVHGAACYSKGGFYKDKPHQIWVPGVERRIWVPAEYEYYTDRWGIRRQRQVCGGHYDIIQEPGHYDTHYEKVWVPRRLICRY